MSGVGAAEERSGGKRKRAAEEADFVHYVPPKAADEQSLVHNVFTALPRQPKLSKTSAALRVRTMNGQGSPDADRPGHRPAQPSPPQEEAAGTSLGGKSARREASRERRPSPEQATRKGLLGDAPGLHTATLPVELPTDQITVAFGARGIRREWLWTRGQPERPPKRGLETDFTLATYNVLSQRYLEQCGYLYGHAHPEDLRWDVRWPRLALDLRLLAADLFCLQELEEAHFHRHFAPYLASLGYAGHFKRKTEDKTDGVGLFYRRERFALLSLTEVNFAHFHAQNRVLQHPQVGLVAVLRPAEGGAEDAFVLATTHLIFNPARGDVKLAQLASLLAAVDRAAWDAERRLHRPVVLCGDLNLEPLSPLYNFLLTGRLELQGKLIRELSGQGRQGGPALATTFLPPDVPFSRDCVYWEEEKRRQGPPKDALAGLTRSSGTLRHGLKLASAYRHQTRQGRPEVSTRHKDRANVDYVLYSLRERRAEVREVGGQPQLVMGDVEEGPLRCLAHWSLLDDQQIWASTGPLPNRHCASDHFPLIVRFRLALHQPSSAHAQPSEAQPPQPSTAAIPDSPPAQPLLNP